MLTEQREKSNIADAPASNVPVGKAQPRPYVDYFLDQYRTMQDQIARGFGAINHDIYEKRLTEPDADLWPEFRLTPYSMYFYYVRINSDGRLVIDHYFYVDGDEIDPKTWKPIPHNEQGLRDIVTKLAMNARPLRKGDTRLRNPGLKKKGNFARTKWDRKSYIAIYFDEANWSLRKKASGSGESAVTFVVDDGVKRGTPNHSFFDAIDLKITMPINRKPFGRTDERSAIVFVNHMKADEEGRELGDDERQEFAFKIILDVKSDVADDPPTVFIIDPGGENGGPSVPPPPA